MIFKDVDHDEVKDFVAINFSEYFKSARTKLYSKQVRNKISEKTC